jgi:hypothetical protein
MLCSLFSAEAPPYARSRKDRPVKDLTGWKRRRLTACLSREFERSARQEEEQELHSSMKQMYSAVFRCFLDSI